MPIRTALMRVVLTALAAAGTFISYRTDRDVYGLPALISRVSLGHGTTHGFPLLAIRMYVVMSRLYQSVYAMWSSVDPRPNSLLTS